MATRIHLHLLGQACALRQPPDGTAAVPVRLSPRRLHLLAYLALNWRRPQRREELEAHFWPDASPHAAANNLRQFLWQLRQDIAADTLLSQDEVVAWSPATPPWVDALAFEASLDAGDLEAALTLYAGPLLPDCYDEWAQVERERLHLRYLSALETRGHQRYEARRWPAALADADALLAADPLNEAAARLIMACHWALGQREAARRCYDVYRARVRSELQTDPLPETTALYQRILRGESHPDQAATTLDASLAARVAHLSLLETLGAFRQGLEQATAWAGETSGAALAIALDWQGCFRLRLGQLAEARALMTAALPLAVTADQQAAMLTHLATVETGLAEYDTAAQHYDQALRIAPVQSATRTRLLSSLGGLLGRQGRIIEARRTLEEAIDLARHLDDAAPLAVASGNLGILLIGQGDPAAAKAALDEALAAARRSDAHWLTAHLTGHLGVLAQDRGDWNTAGQHYETARALADAVGDRRGALLWTLNLGIVYYEQGRCAEALPLLTEGQQQAVTLGVKSLEAGARIFRGGCLTAQGRGEDGLASIEAGLTLAQAVCDQERILMGCLHRGRALIALGRAADARNALQEGLRLAAGSGMRRLAEYLQVELEKVTGDDPPTFNL